MLAIDDSVSIACARVVRGNGVGGERGDLPRRQRAHRRRGCGAASASRDRSRRAASSRSRPARCRSAPAGRPSGRGRPSRAAGAGSASTVTPAASIGGVGKSRRPRRRPPRSRPRSRPGSASCTIPGRARRAARRGGLPGDRDAHRNSALRDGRGVVILPRKDAGQAEPSPTAILGAPAAVPAVP